MIINVKDREYRESFWIAQEAAVAATKQQILRNKQRRARIMGGQVREAMNGKQGFVEETLKAGSHD